MTLVLLALAVGVAVGYARGGRLRRLTDEPPERNRLLITALGLYVTGALAGVLLDSLWPVFTGLGWLVVVFYLRVNRRFQGATLLALGLAANAVVLLANAAVPVSAGAAERAGADPSAMSSGQPVIVADDDTRLAFLGKTIPVAFPPRPEVVSPGDVAVAAGLAVLLSAGMTGRLTPAPTPGARATMDDAS